MLFGQCIREARNAAKLTLEQAAERADISANYLGSMERGDRRPSLGMIFKLAAAYQVAPSVFFQWSEPTPEENLRNLCMSSLDKCTPAQLRMVYRVLLAMDWRDKDK